MNTYIPADKLIAEIDRQQRRLILLSNTKQVDMRRDCAIQNGAYEHILGIIASLRQEQPEVDLEKEIERIVKNEERFMNFQVKSQLIKYVARHFYALGLNARKEVQP